MAFLSLKLLPLAMTTNFQAIEIYGNNNLYHLARRVLLDKTTGEISPMNKFVGEQGIEIIREDYSDAP